MNMAALPCELMAVAAFVRLLWAGTADEPSIPPRPSVQLSPSGSVMAAVLEDGEQSLGTLSKHWISAEPPGRDPEWREPLSVHGSEDSRPCALNLG